MGVIDDQIDARMFFIASSNKQLLRSDAGQGRLLFFLPPLLFLVGKLLLSSFIFLIVEESHFVLLFALALIGTHRHSHASHHCFL